MFWSFVFGLLWFVSSFEIRISCFPVPLRWLNRMICSTILYCHFRMHNVWDGVLTYFRHQRPDNHPRTGIRIFVQTHNAAVLKFKNRLISCGWRSTSELLRCSRVEKTIPLEPSWIWFRCNPLILLWLAVNKRIASLQPSREDNSVGAESTS